MNKEAIRTARAELQAKRTRATELKAHNDGMIDDAVKEETVNSTDFIEKYEAATREYDGLRDEIEALDEHLRRLMGNGEEAQSPFADTPRPETPSEPLGWGDTLLRSDVYTELKGSKKLDSDKARIGQTNGVEVTSSALEVKALLTSADYPLQPQRDAAVMQRKPIETITILDLISIGTCDTEIVEWVVQTLRDDNAGSAAEGVAFSESDYEWDTKSAQIQEVGHYHKATKRALKDEGQLRTLVNQELLDGLRAKVQRLIISGDGEGTDFTGLYNTDDILSVSHDEGKGDEHFADTVHRGMTAIRVANLGQIEPQVIGLHPNDWERHVLTKDENKNYINGGPNAPGPRTIWGMVPAVHVAFPEHNPLIGDYRQAKLWIWSNVALSFTDSNEDDFLKRLVAVMASFGGAFGVPRPIAFCEVQTEDHS